MTIIGIVVLVFAVLVLFLHWLDERESLDFDEAKERQKYDTGGWE